MTSVEVLVEKAKIAIHKGWVRGIAFAPQHNSLVSGSYDKTVRVWNCDTHAQIEEYQGHKDWVWSVAVSESGRKTRVATGGLDKIVRVFELGTKRLVQEFTSHTGTINCVSISPDGAIVASASYDKTCRLFEIGGKEIHRFEDHTGPVTGVAFSPDGVYIGTTSLDRTLRVYTVADKSLVFQKTYESALLCIAFSPAGTLIVGGQDKKARVIDIASANEFLIITHHHDFINTVAFSADGSLFALGSTDNTASVCDAMTGTVLGHTPKTKKGHSEEVASVAFGRDVLITASDDCTIRFWDLPTPSSTPGQTPLPAHEMDMEEID